MNRQLKILSVLTIISGIVTIAFWIIDFNSNFSLLETFKNNLEILFIHLVLLLFTIREKSIVKKPLKELFAEVVNLQVDWDSLNRNNDLLATFKISNDLYWTFNVPEEIFNGLDIGQKGILSYKEQKSKAYFVFFTILDNQDTSNQADV